MLNFENKKILIVGGGNIASQKLEKILDFTENITIVSLQINETIETIAHAHNLSTHLKSYDKNDALGFDVIIVCVDNTALQEQIFKQTRQTRTLVNSVDSPKCCDFIFPSYIKKDELVISVSSSSYAPALSRALRIYLEKLIPKDIDVLLKQLKNIRKEKEKGRSRQNELSGIVNDFFTNMKNRK